jgi:hypothetical protein
MRSVLLPAYTRYVTFCVRGDHPLSGGRMAALSFPVLSCPALPCPALPCPAPICVLWVCIYT